VSRGPSAALLGRAALQDTHRRVRGCARPIRLQGSTTRRRVDPTTGAPGEVIDRYSSAQELDGYTWVRCGDRRAHRCESCSREYKGDAWHLLTAGLEGGKGVPSTVVEHPTVFATLTPPSFGPVHGRRDNGAPCRPRRDRPCCPHGRPRFCFHRHKPDAGCLGEPLCEYCYDYVGHVLWQWHAPELWRRFTITLGRRLATYAGVTVTDLRDLARVSYTKVVELQARGLVHVHAVMRLDGPDGPDTPPGLDVDATQFGALIEHAARAVYLDVTPAVFKARRLAWGDQIDVRPITSTAARDARTGEVHPELVAGYLAKYLTKSTEDFGLESAGKVHSARDAYYLGASRHAVRIIETAEHIAAVAGEDYARLADRHATLGYRGHVLTKTRRYSTTFGELRSTRREWRRTNPTGIQPVDHEAADVDPDGDDAVVVERRWRYAGSGYLDADQAALALTAAALALEHTETRS
jgi:hypothetical protein